ncbi:MAG: acetylxylan esterase [Anaerolineae bacterium]|nr:acetylxylan esterase [Anaerolineae bacterium]
MTNFDYPELAYYPDPETVDAFVADLWQTAQSIPYAAELTGETGFTMSLGIRHMHGFQYVAFMPEGMAPFYGYWQPALSQPAPLLIHVPGYGAEMSLHPDLVAQGYNVLHVNPLGYVTPTGAVEDKKYNGTWPVFGETVLSGGKRGYRQWFINAIQAVMWAQARETVLPDRVSFFGTSQGGGTSLLLGSIFRDHGARCVAADEPWMTYFAMCKALQTDWFTEILERIATMAHPEDTWRILGTIDSLAHVHRLTMPVLLTAGGKDHTCPAPTIAALFDHLSQTKAYIYLHDKEHGYMREFITMAAGWFRLYA